MRQIFISIVFVTTIFGHSLVWADLGGELRCQETAIRVGFLQGDSEMICAGAESDGPALCAHKAYQTYFSKQQSIELCQKGAIENANCAINAYQDALYSTDEAVQACKVN